jgi:dTDP-4-amino-4,6-dideoxygalactose transaminase
MNSLETRLRVKRNIAKKIINSLCDLDDITLPKIPKNSQPSWYAFIMHYAKADRYNVSRSKLYEALIAEGCHEIDLPNSTCPLNYLPLFQNPKILFPKYRSIVRYTENDFSNARTFHETSIKLPVWYLEKDKDIVNLYIKAITKVIQNIQELV